MKVQIYTYPITNVQHRKLIDRLFDEKIDNTPILESDHFNGRWYYTNGSPDLSWQIPEAEESGFLTEDYYWITTRECTAVYSALDDIIEDLGEII